LPFDFTQGGEFIEPRLCGKYSEFFFCVLYVLCGKILLPFGCGFAALGSLVLRAGQPRLSSPACSVSRRDRLDQEDPAFNAGISWYKGVNPPPFFLKCLDADNARLPELIRDLITGEMV